MRVYSKRKDNAPRTAVYVGRPSKWGNPFEMGKDGDRAAVIARYREYLGEHPELVAEARVELRGKDLVCWCAPLACHADVLMKAANDDGT